MNLSICTDEQWGPCLKSAQGQVAFSKCTGVLKVTDQTQIYHASNEVHPTASLAQTSIKPKAALKGYLRSGMVYRKEIYHSHLEIQKTLFKTMVAS